MPKKRIFQVAKDLNISHLDIIKFLKSNDVEVASVNSPLEDDVYEMILSEFNKERLEIERLRKEKARQAIVNEIAEKENEAVLEKKEDSLLKGSPVENKIGLKILERPDEKEKEKKISKDSPVDKKQKVNESSAVSIKEVSKPSPKRKLKQIDISAIAEKINQGKKDKKNNKVDSSVLNKTLSAQSKKKKRKKKEIEDEEVVETSDLKVIKIPEFSSVDELAQTMNVKSQDIIMSCMGLGLMVTINQRLDMDTIIMVADEFDITVETLDIYTEELIEDSEIIDEKDLVVRPPVVTIMGHVDHGKTSLLDYIRDTNIIAGESGGITQHIGAYEVEVKDKNKITFIDTPGHAAFTAMRARGAQVTDVVILIVAADDGLKPQTLEAIDHAQAASVPMIVAINKIDLPGSNPENVKKQLSEKNILVEEWGGKYQCAEISAKKGTGIDQLLDKILIESEMLDLKASQKAVVKGVVVEAQLDKGLGPVATILIQQGSLSKGDIFLCGSQHSKVRELLNERGDSIKVALPSDPVQVLGFNSVPNAGELFKVYKDEREAKKIALQRSQLEREAIHQRYEKLTLDQIGKEIKSGSVKDLNILIKGDVDGSIEALSDSLMNLSNDEVNVKIVLKAAGMISQNDITLASASKAIIVAFNVSSSVNARKLAKEYGIDIRYYSVIYEAIEEIKLALEGLLDPDIVEDSIGQALVKDSFKIPKVGIIAGCSIDQGKVIRNSLLRVKREDETIYEGKLTSLKRFKEDVNEVKTGYECGIGVAGFYDFKENDIIEVYEQKEVKRKLK